MTRDDFNQFCASLPATTNVVQWGDASVWKVGGKIFAICSTWGESGAHTAPERFSFKCTDLSYQILIEQDGIIPAPYLARAKWVQVQSPSAMTDEDLRTYIQSAHKIIAGKLTKKQRQDLGLNDL